MSLTKCAQHAYYRVYGLRMLADVQTKPWGALTRLFFVSPTEKRVLTDEVPRIARARGLDLWGERDESVGRVERKWRRRCDESPIAVTEQFARTARRPDGQTDGRRRATSEKR